jgi:uncharacterized protein YggE
MNEDKPRKQFLHIAASIALIAFSYAAIEFVQSYDKTIQPSSFRSFSVSAEGKVTKIPDVAEFNFSVISEGGNDLAALQKNTADKNNAIISFLKTKKIEEKNIKTLSHSISPRYEQCYAYQIPGGVCPPPKIVGYTVEQTTQVKIHALEIVGDVLAGVADKGANSVGQLEFRIDDETAAQAQARAEAIKKAQEKAQEIAKSAKFNVGRLLGITEGFSYPTYETKMSYAMDSVGAAPSTSPTVSAGSQEIVVTVTLNYEIK